MCTCMCVCVCVCVCVYLKWAFPGGSAMKNPPAHAGDAGSIPGSERCPGRGNGNPLQYSCLENPMVRGTWSMGLQRVKYNLAIEHACIHIYAYILFQILFPSGLFPLLNHCCHSFNLYISICLYVCIYKCFCMYVHAHKYTKISIYT